MVYLSCSFLKIVVKRQQIRAFLSLFNRIYHYITHFIDLSKYNFNMPYDLGKKTNSIAKKKDCYVIYSIDSERNHCMES